MEKVIGIKKIVVFEKDKKSRQIMDILCRQLGHADVADVETQEDFDKTVAASVDKSSGLGGLLGKSARPKTSVDLFIIDVDSPAGRLSTLVRSLKSQFSGNPRFLVVGASAASARWRRP